MPMEYMLKSGEVVEVDPEEWVSRSLEWLQYARDHVGDKDLPAQPGEVAHGLAKAARNLRALGTVLIGQFDFTLDDLEREINAEASNVQEEIHTLFAETQAKKSRANQTGTFRVSEDYIETFEWIMSTVRMMKAEIGGVMDAIESTR